MSSGPNRPRGSVITNIESDRASATRVRPASDVQRAGLTMFNVRPSWVGVVRENGVVRVTFAQEREEAPGPVLAGRAIHLRVTVTPDQAARFSYSLDGGRASCP